MNILRECQVGYKIHLSLHFLPHHVASVQHCLETTESCPHPQPTPSADEALGPLSVKSFQVA